MSTNSTIIVVEDDQDIREYLRDVLLEKDFIVEAVGDGVTALKQIKKLHPDLVVLDLGLPTMGGESVCKEAKRLYPELPIIILTAKNATSDVVKGLNFGADDYIAKPFEIDELLARIHARLRAKGGSEEKLTVGDLELDTKTLEVRRENKIITLTPQEFKLLEYLMNNKGRVLTRDTILNRIWLYSPDIDTRVVDVYVGYLRKKIDAGFTKKLLRSVRGFGYMIRE